MVDEGLSKKCRLCVGFFGDQSSGEDFRSRWHLVDLPQGEKEIAVIKSFEGPVGCPAKFSIASLGSTLYLVGGVELSTESVLSGDENLWRRCKDGRQPSRSVFSIDVENGKGWVRQGDLNTPRVLPTIVVSPPDEHEGRGLYCFGSRYMGDIFEEESFGEVLKPSASNQGTWTSTGAPPIIDCNLGWGPIGNAGFATIDRRRYLFVNAGMNTSCFNLEDQKWTYLNQDPMLLDFGSSQAIVVDNFWYVCDTYDDGVVYAQRLESPEKIEDFVHTLNLLDDDFYRKKLYNHHLVQIDTKTMCRVSIPKTFMKTKEIRCIRFQVVQQSDGSLCACNFTRNYFTVDGQYGIGCVVLEQNNAVLRRSKRKRTAQNTIPA